MYLAYLQTNHDPNHHNTQPVNRSFSLTWRFMTPFGDKLTHHEVIRLLSGIICLKGMTYAPFGDHYAHRPELIFRFENFHSIIIPRTVLNVGGKVKVPFANDALLVVTCLSASHRPLASVPILAVFSCYLVKANQKKKLKWNTYPWCHI